MLRDLIEVSRGEKPADLLLKNCQLVNVFSGEIEPTSVAVFKDAFAGFGNYSAQETIDLNGQYVCPSFIDSHVHIELSLLNPAEFADAAAINGTGAVISVPNAIANVLGADGIKYFLDVTKDLNCDFYFTLPSAVPSSSLDDTGAKLEAKTLAQLLKKERIVGLSEIMNYPGVIAGSTEVLKKIDLFENTVVDGHAPGLSGKNLQAYIAAGIDNEAEASTLNEAKEKLKYGMHIKIQEGSYRQNLASLVPLVNQTNWPFFSFCSNDIYPNDLKKGHINLIVKNAIKLGMDPLTAIRLATISPVMHYSIKNRGAISPGYQADFLVLEDLHDFKIRRVYKRGKLVVRKNELLQKTVLKKKSIVKQTFNVAPFKPGAFNIGPVSNNARVIELLPGQIVTNSKIEEMKIQNDLVVAQPEKDIIKVAVVERHKGTGSIGVGLLSGFGLKRGALAQSIAHDSHNIICVGISSEDMASAVRQVIKLKGGIVVVMGGFVLAQLPLPIAGLMSEENMEKVLTELEKLNDALNNLGIQNKDPVNRLSFLANPIVPNLRITSRGLVDVEKNKVVKLFA